MQFAITCNIGLHRKQGNGVGYISLLMPPKGIIPYAYGSPEMKPSIPHSTVYVYERCNVLLAEVVVFTSLLQASGQVRAPCRRSSKLARTHFSAQTTC